MAQLLPWRASEGSDVAWHDQTTIRPASAARGPAITARALLLGDRLDMAGLERSDVLSTAPLAFRAGQDGFVALFRYGVAVLVGLTPLEEDEVIRSLRQRIVGEFARHEEETAIDRIVARQGRPDPARRPDLRQGRCRPSA